MNALKRIATLSAIAALTLNLAYAGSTSTSSTVKDGKKITTKVQTANDGTTTTTVTTKDKDGTVTTMTTVADKDGNIISTDDPQARANAEAVAKQKQEQAAKLANAPKRGPNDPIQMALFQTAVSEDLRKATTKEGVFPYLRKEFENDSIIKLMDQKEVDQYDRTYDFRTGKYKQFSSFDRGPEYLPADIYVETSATLEEKVGINKATHKLAKAPFLVYRAVIYSEYSDKKWDVSDEGFILQNVQVTKSFANKIRQVVMNEIAPTIPAHAENYRRARSGMVKGQAGKGQVDAKEALRNLFKKRKK